MKYAQLGPIAVHYPQRRETNDDLRALFPAWDMDAIYEKTGIFARYIAGPDECASDLGVAAAQKLFQQHQIDPASIDFLLFCTQAPDYPLPTTACLMQQRLGLPTHCGALDFNLGCSGFVYGLALADGLIRTGSVRRVLLITAETYSKYIDPADRSLRTIFGDAAAATLVEAADGPSLSGFRYGTDGSGGDTLLVNQGGARPAKDAIKPRHRKRWASPLYMDGPSLIGFSVVAVPKLVDEVLRGAGLLRESVDLYLLHQATKKMMDQLQQCLGLTEAEMPLLLEHCGNTVSSTIPILIDHLRGQGRLKPGMRSVLVGFGVGWSWAGCVWEETWSPCGYLLIASPRLADPNFHHSVVLLIHHDADGALGLVLNRLSDSTLSDVAEAFDPPASQAPLGVYVGGPVPGPLMVLHTQPEYSEHEIVSGVHLCVNPDRMRGLLAIARANCGRLEAIRVGLAGNWNASAGPAVGCHCRLSRNRYSATPTRCGCGRFNGSGNRLSSRCWGVCHRRAIRRSIEIAFFLNIY